jgi:hypothetical protein
MNKLPAPLTAVGFLYAGFVVTSYDDEPEDHLRVLSGTDLSKTVMPFIAAFMTFEKRLKTMNKGKPLATEIMDFFEEQMNRGVAMMSLEDMVDTTASLCTALEFDRPVSEQVG